ncbi:hypothetical protein TL16_g11229 [Triparma laevis f. inornata]|uniref:Peptidase A1 domain-containing protein n=1 Tax=Triparma laevis f. inornata TaxID=1714386 RepID=A0A9W7BCW6_9STRA|nr:hypothetical protein TL16_g11229 [Triparma laevis f. inornata]
MNLAVATYLLLAAAFSTATPDPNMNTPFAGDNIKNDDSLAAAPLLPPHSIRTVSYSHGVRHLTGSLNPDDALMMSHDLRRIETEFEYDDEESLREFSRHERRQQTIDQSQSSDSHRALSTTAPDPVQVTPVFQGIGTHYADIWVGQPKTSDSSPQRQTVIVDTGSHYTAFPCTGCTSCGEEYHTNKLYDVTQSSTFHKITCSECDPGGHCNKNQCEFSQSYTEGSSWKAYQAVDRFWVGRANHDQANKEFDYRYAIEFMFGCQYSETGLFIKQLANGIMGMSASESTIVKHLYDQDKIKHNLFTMCFQRHDFYEKDQGVGSGAMIFGGVDTRLHTSPMLFVKDLKATGWYTVYIDGIYLRDNTQDANGGNPDSVIGSQGSQTDRINLDIQRLNNGKGVIVDSGTTDTYLSSSARGAFEKMWKEKSGGLTFKHSSMSFDNPEDINKLPTILFQLRSDSNLNPNQEYEGINSASSNLDPSNPHDILIAMPPSHYMELNAKTGKYVPRIYFTEGSGGVLGANFMQGHDVLFDWENQRVGFARSDCDYNSIPLDGVIESPDADCAFLEEAEFIRDACSAADACVKAGGTSDVTKGVMSGVENWGRVIGTQARGTGKKCEDAAKKLASAGSTFLDCDDAKCYETRPCECTCGGSDVDPQAPPFCRDLDWTDASIDDSSADKCEDLWGSCHLPSPSSPSCSQLRVQSAYNENDGNCYKVGNETRSCNIAACAADTFRVPIKVQTILGLKSTTNISFSNIQLQTLEDSVASALSDQSVQPGDARVVTSRTWTNIDNEEGSALGVKVILEISIPYLNYGDPSKNLAKCSSMITATTSVAAKVDDAVQDSKFTTKLFELLSASSTKFEGVTRITMLESWQQQMAFCNGGGGGGGYPWSPGGGDDGESGPSSAAAVIFSFLAAFVFVGAYMHFKAKKRAAALGRYTGIRDSESGEDGIELRSNGAAVV